MPTTPKLDILDIIIRHQVYVEFFKNENSESGSDAVDWIMTNLSLFLTKIGKSDFAELTKKELTEFVSYGRKQIARGYGTFNKEMLAKIKAFFLADYSMLKTLLGSVTKQSAAKAPAASKLWAKLLNQPSPGTGEEPKQLLRTFAASAYNGFAKLAKQAFAEKWTFADFIKALTGTKSLNYRDGLAGKWKNQLDATVRTFISTASNFLNYTIGKILFDEYQWVSVLDERTTEICRHRDGNVYRYGNGPIPPAHYRCRSSIVPVIDRSVPVVPTFGSWILRQPVTVMDDILGTNLAREARRGNASPDDLTSVLRKRKLSLDNFIKKSKLILTPTKSE